MGITDHEVVAVPPRWLFLRVETSDGRVGWGEHVSGAGPRTVETAVEELFESYLLGEDPAPIEDHWQAMYRGGFYRGGPVLMSAIAGVDQALWDLKGKELGAPVYELLGGPARDRVRVYQWIGGDRPSDVADQAREKAAEGFTAFKMNATEELERIDSPASVQQAADRLAAVREAVGDDMDVAVDLHGRATKTMAARLIAALEPHDPFFVEEPVLPEHNDALPDLARQTTVPIATGERMYTRMDFKQVLEANAVDVVQPDLSHAGGITETHKIAAMADAYDVSLAPHCPLGPIALAACLQVDAAAPNALIQEQSLDIHYNRGADLLDYLEDPDAFAFDDGYVTPPPDPGLGVTIDEDVVRERAGVDWDGAVGRYRPTWRRGDGSVTEW